MYRAKAFLIGHVTALVLGACVGPEGPAGEMGERGEMGLRGERGPAGETGPQGEVGDAGAPGARGERGPQGEVGDAGARGARGERGPQGEMGATGLVPLRTITCSLATYETHPTVGAVRGIYSVTEFESGLIIVKCEVTRLDPHGTVSNTFLWLPGQRGAEINRCELSGPLGDWLFYTDKDSVRMADYEPHLSPIDGGMPITHVLVLGGACKTFPEAAEMAAQGDR